MTWTGLVSYGQWDRFHAENNHRMSRTIAVLITQGLIFLLQIISIFLGFNCHVKKKTFVWLRHRIVYGMMKGHSILININLNAHANGVHGPGRSF